MTLQQLEYVVALDKCRHFVKAADSCKVSQSTLSTMIRKLEEELDTFIFDRDAHPIKPTPLGEKIISHAKIILYNVEQIQEVASLEKNLLEGEINLGVIPTVAPYLIPPFFEEIQKNSPFVFLNVSEMKTCDLLSKLSKAELDLAIMATPSLQKEFLVIPLYYEKFYAYVSKQDPFYEKKELVSRSLSAERLWTLSEGNCMREQIFKFCNLSQYSARYETGSIDTLVKIVDRNGGYTIIPELHLNMLSLEQKLNIRPIKEPEVAREISILIRKDFVRERILNEIVNSIKKVIPEEMLDNRLKKFAITL